MLRRSLHQIPALRRAVLPLLQRFNPGDIHIRHHWTGDRVVLDAFKHKAYWYRGKNREHGTMLLFAALVARGDTVIEVGGHIGYVSLYLAQLTGPSGHVTVFEPGPNNLPYLRRNAAHKPWIEVREQAVAERAGTARFYLENVSGQNNSLLEHCRVREHNEKHAFLGSDLTGSSAGSIVDVSCTTLDELVQGTSAPSFIKIDVEGAELRVLQGMPELLRRGVALMVEVSEGAAEVRDLLTAASYQLFNERRERIETLRAVRGNIFCLRAEDPRLALFQG
jgi:FkbM family methyltransferase